MVEAHATALNCTVTFLSIHVAKTDRFQSRVFRQSQITEVYRGKVGYIQQLDVIKAGMSG